MLKEWYPRESLRIRARCAPRYSESDGQQAHHKAHCTTAHNSWSASPTGSSHTALPYIIQGRGPSSPAAYKLTFIAPLLFILSH